MRILQVKYIYLSVALMAGVLSASAQETPTLTSIERMERSGFWKRSGNAGGAKLDQPLQYSRLQAGFSQYGGSFKRPQQGDSGNMLDISTDGNITLGEFLVTGAFGFRRETVDDANYNASIMDPYRGMPFIVADVNPSDWNKQHYDLQATITSPTLHEHWTLGLAARYQASNGAKLRDIRTENDLMQVQVSPSIVYSISPKRHVGLTLSYQNMKEESAMGNVNNYVDQPYYELQGLGNAIDRVGSGRANNYEGEALGAGLQFQSLGAIGLFVSVNYKREAEDLQAGFLTPYYVGTALRNIWNAELSLTKDTERFSHVLDLDFYSRNIDGIQYINQRDDSEDQQGYLILLKNVRSTYNTTTAGLNYSILRKRNQDYSWMGLLGVRYQKLSDKYLLPNSSKAVENLLFTTGLKKNAVIAEKRAASLLFGVELGYSANLSGDYIYGGPNADFPTVSGLEMNDFRYLKSSFFSVNIPVVYSQRLKENSNKMFFAKANLEGQFTNKYDFNSRCLAGLNVGIVF